MLKVENFTRTFLAAPINAAQTTIQVAPGTGSTFPTLSVGDYTFATLVHPQTNAHEIVRIVDITADTFTVVRAQDDSSAQSFPVASEIKIQWNKQQVFDWAQQANAYSGVAPISVVGQSISLDAVPGLTAGTYANPAITINDKGLITAVGTTSTAGYASETVPGLSQIATLAEVTAGLDALKYVTPLRLQEKIVASSINGSINAGSNQMTLGNGAILKWGTVTLNNPSGVSGGSDSESVTYPTPFPTAVFAVWASPRLATSLLIFKTTLGSASSFTASADFGVGGSTQLGWIALGH